MLNGKVYQKLAAIQTALKAPKSQFNKFGGYKYRKAEDILEAVKPLLKEHGCALTCSDDLQQIGDRYYIKATAMLICAEDGSYQSCEAYAREEEEKKFDFSILDKAVEDSRWTDIKEIGEAPKGAEPEVEYVKIHRAAAARDDPSPGGTIRRKRSGLSGRSAVCKAGDAFV